MYTDVVEVIGSFGIYHGILLLLACIRAFPVAWTNMMSPLMAADVAHWCAAPVGVTNDSWWKENGIPRGPTGELEECSMFLWTSENGLDTSSRTNCTNGWSYDKGEFGETATSEWDLVCGDVWKRSLMQSIIMAGAWFGLIVFGRLSDDFGRKTAFVISLVVLMLSGVCASFVSSFLVFNILRFLLSTTTAGLTAAAVTIFMEVMPGKDRIFLNVGFGMGYAVPVMFIPLLSYYFSNFRHMQLAIGLSGLLLIPFVPLLAESPKWLLAKHRLNDAERSITKIMKMNNQPMPNMHTVMPELARLAETESAQKSKNLGFLDMMRVPILRRTSLVLGGLWFMNSLRTYYLAVNSHRLPGNPHVNFAISAFSEFPASLAGMVLIRKCRRRTSQVGCAVLAIVLFTIVFFFSEHSHFLSVWGSMLVRSSLNIIILLQWVQVHEVYPTPARGAGFALAMMSSRVGAGMAPFVKDIGDRTFKSLPYYLFLVCAALDVFLMCLLPETLNARLPDTIEDAEKLLKQTRGLFSKRTRISKHSIDHS